MYDNGIENGMGPFFALLLVKHMHSFILPAFYLGHLNEDKLWEHIKALYRIDTSVSQSLRPCLSGENSQLLVFIGKLR